VGQRFDHVTDALFVLHNEITSRIANALEVELITAEAARPTEHPDALDYILRGRAARLKPNSRDSFVERISLFEHALALDPQSVEAQSRLASSLVGRVFDLMTGSAAADLARADRLIRQALAASPRYALAHHVKGQVLRAQNRLEEAIPEYETVIELDRNAPGAYANLGWCKFLTGSIEEAIPALEQALRLSTRDHRAGNWLGRIGLVHLLQSCTDEAILWLEKARAAGPAFPLVHIWLAAAYALKGANERAAAELAEARRLDGGDLFSSLRHARLAQAGEISGFDQGADLRHTQPCARKGFQASDARQHMATARLCEQSLLRCGVTVGLAKKGAPGVFHRPASVRRAMRAPYHTAGCLEHRGAWSPPHYSPW
jgi:tetratricopeptide (TPR) repeat protein